MTATVHRERLAVGALGAGGLAGMALYLALPAFEGYVPAVMGLLSGVAGAVGHVSSSGASGRSGSSHFPPSLCRSWPSSGTRSTDGPARPSTSCSGPSTGARAGGCPIPTCHLLLIWVVVAGDALFGARLLGTYVLGRGLPVAVLGAVFRDRPIRVARLFRGRYGTFRAVKGPSSCRSAAYWWSSSGCAPSWEGRDAYELVIRSRHGEHCTASIGRYLRDQPRVGAVDAMGYDASLVEPS